MHSGALCAADNVAAGGIQCPAKGGGQGLPLWSPVTIHPLVAGAEFGTSAILYESQQDAHDVPNPWFRCYSEFADDPKVQMMTEQMQRRLVMLFCNRCKEETLHETQRAFHWRISVSELAETKAIFLENGFIDDHWNLLNWNRRQFLSDSSTERVRKYRQALKHDETFPKQEGNVTVTSPDTDTEQSRAEQTPLALTSVEVPTGRGKLLGTILLNKGEYEVRADDLSRDGPLYPGVDVLAEYRAMKAWSIANPTQRKTPKGIARFMNNWLAKAQNNGGKNVGTQQSQRIDPNSDRFARSIEAIGGAAARRYGGRTGADDGAGKGPVPQPDDARSDGGHVPGGVGRDGAEVRPGDVKGRVIDGVA